ncbi:hypothetical protein HWV62_36717 [Athelia sp. TMB]|nr:hypothetical protein HWV62_36717 [Athelia sp. TMB]
MTQPITDAIPSGHLGNVSAEQEATLKQMWAAFFALDGQSEAPKSATGVTIDLTEANKYVKECGGFEKFHETFWRTPYSGHPDSTMLRFLRARKWNVSAALGMLACATAWRIELNVDNIVEQGEELLNKDLPGFDLQMKSGKAYLHGADAKGRPVFYIHVKIHNPNQQTFEALRTFTIYCMETGRLFLAPPTNQACLVFDLTGFGLKNMDWAFVKFLVKAFEAYYPETLGTLAIHKAPWVFSSIWTAIRPLLDPVVASKIVFTKNEKQLMEVINADQLPKGMGGSEDWEWEYTDCVTGENARVHDTDAHAKHIAKRALLCSRFEESTRAWVNTPVSDEKSTQARDQAVLEYRIASIEADPFIRPRTVYHRHGNLLEDGTVHWSYKSSAGDQNFGIPVERLRDMVNSGNVDASPETSSAPLSDFQEKLEFSGNGDGLGLEKMGLMSMNGNGMAVQAVT